MNFWNNNIFNNSILKILAERILFHLKWIVNGWLVPSWPEQKNVQRNLTKRCPSGATANLLAGTRTSSSKTIVDDRAKIVILLYLYFKHSWNIKFLAYTHWLSFTYILYLFRLIHQLLSNRPRPHIRRAIMMSITVVAVQPPDSFF